jgi:hypothetical protein
MTRKQKREYRAVAQQVFPRADDIHVDADGVFVVLTETPERWAVQAWQGKLDTEWGTVIIHFGRTIFIFSVPGATLEQALRIGKAKLREHYTALAPHVVEDDPCP